MDRGLWHLGVGAVIMGFWWVAACDQEIPTTHPSSSDKDIIDDDDYDHIPTPTLTPLPTNTPADTPSHTDTPNDQSPSSESPTPSTRCTITGQLTIDNPEEIPSQAQVLRLAFYTGEQLDAQQHPQDIHVFDTADDLPITAESFPLTYQVTLDKDRNFLGEAWIDGNLNQAQDQGDFLGYSSTIETEGPCPLVVDWALFRL